MNARIIEGGDGHIREVPLYECGGCGRLYRSDANISGWGKCECGGILYVRGSNPWQVAFRGAQMPPERVALVCQHRDQYSTGWATGLHILMACRFCGKLQQDSGEWWEPVREADGRPAYPPRRAAGGE